MSTEEDKFKKSKRLLKDDNAINKQLKIAKEFGVPIKEPHRLAKQHTLDCGNTKCLLCHGEKVFGKKTIKERRFEQDMDTTSDKRSNGLKNDQEDLI
jgi:cytochrome c5